MISVHVEELRGKAAIKRAHQTEDWSPDIFYCLECDDQVYFSIREREWNEEAQYLRIEWVCTECWKNRDLVDHIEYLTDV